MVERETLLNVWKWTINGHSPNTLVAQDSPRIQYVAPFLGHGDIVVEKTVYGGIPSMIGAAHCLDTLTMTALLILADV